MISSVYIHIPFCHHICHYCDFTKFFYNEEMAANYLTALENEMNTAIKGSNNKVKTIFIGGGTPSALTVDQLDKLMKIIHGKFAVAQCEEFSMEANPGDLTKEKIDLIKSYGVNRISLGVQVFDNEMLRELGRAHQIKDVYETINDLKASGFSNISIDMIYALPKQTVSHFARTLQEALSFHLPHYSAYALQIEPKTIFYNRFRKGQLHRPEQEEEVEMYQVLREQMQSHGVRQYEISNFAKPGFESKHNLTYWNNAYYYGFGAGASGYLPGKRITNIKPLPAYIKQSNLDGKPVLRVEKIGLKEQIEEEMFLGMRKTKGVDIANFSTKFGISLTELYADQIDYLQQKNWVEVTDGFIRLTNEGMLFGNDVFVQFLLDTADLERVY
ncbi:radical SAM family heme chaperone HemW [Virgibacillus sp. 179-BFC.A HS]|uniref:Heme chaperone HemW n=1 Tax=Tigheibacillus jepli TaxID=3035914 RepID=A0ABU5CI55_9BACI|nr:radical SAM family heme chaperone HemW [Virgibacillus sp. 179-BFC.A HS]MDY0405522.1 radical SAM family heme chaperone HemW [Virgibacillus sp. 179-BFC.A HS]